MKVLQISCGFNYSSVYNNLFSELARKGIAQEVYNPQHNYFESNSKKDDYLFKYHPSKIIKSYDKLLYFTKIHRMRHDVELNFIMNNVSLIHAHSLFSDGGVAYELYKKYNIPYLIAIRNTDINKYFKYGIHLRPYALKILKNASKIIFISNAYKEEVLRKYIPQSLMKNILSKTEIIPNGIDKYWHKNIKRINKNDREYDFSNQNKLKIIYVGVINKNKNLKTTIKALNILKEKGYEIEFTVVGRLEDESFNYEIKQNSFINYVGQKDKTELIHLYRSNHIFLMPSIKETFGLVYVEAMSQGLPVIYTKGQGFDGQFEEGTVGYSVYATDAEDIADKVLLIRKNYDFLTKACIVNVRKFDWEGIANLYIKLYGTI